MTPLRYSLPGDLEAAVTAGAAALRRGEAVIFPTETVYGVFFCEEGRERVYALKGRDFKKPCALHVGSREALRRALEGAPAGALDFAAERLPGPYTLLVPDGRGGKLGVRYPACPAYCALAEAAGRPVYGTSANLSGARSPMAFADTAPLWEGVAVAADGGALSGRSSEIWDFTAEPPLVIKREN